MTTLATLKAEIANDINRSDLTTEIAEAITAAISYYQTKRFFFNQTRDSTFATVAAQKRYTSSDDADIPKWLKLDAVFLEDSSSVTFQLSRMDHLDMEWHLDANSSSGQPYSYAYFDETFSFHPVPDAVYTIRPIGQIQIAEPASGAEANNPWMTEAYELIRCRAKALLATHVIRSPSLLMSMQGPQPWSEPIGGAEGAALAQLQSETTRKEGGGRIIPTTF